MRSLGWLALVLSVLGLALVTTACRPPSLPGTSAGSFAVTESLATNACAGGFDPPVTLDYTTDIRILGEVAYWHRGDTPVANGTYSSDGHFHFVSQQDVQAYASRTAGAPGCSLREIQTIDGTLALGPSDAGVEDVDGDAGALDASVSRDAQVLAGDGGPDAGVHSTGFTGTDTIQISIAPGSDCSAIFATNGGPFSMLPCTATYAMSAITH